ncbi:MAG: response regulator [Krumholzibacteria bacterium]|nr:response regulator [Candidatus Krumholzibacteria bacterium]
MRESAPNLLDSCEKIVAAVRHVRETVNESYDDIIASMEAIQGQHVLYEEIFKGSKDAILVLHADSGVVLRSNAAACELLGYERLDLPGRDVMELHPPKDHEAAAAALAATRRDGSVRNVASRIVRRDGTVVPVTITAHLANLDGEAHIVGFVRDESQRVMTEEELRRLNEKLGAEIAEKKSAEQELRELNENLERRVAQRTEQIRRTNEELEKTIDRANRLVLEARTATRAKSAFIAHITHELRTPLNAVIGMSELLLDMELGTEQRDTANIVAQSAKSLLGVINEVLDFSKIEAGKLDLESMPFDVRAVVQGVADTFGFQVKEKDLAWRVEVDEQVPAVLEGDAGRLRQILVNLVGNAIKFTARGEVAVRVRVTDAGPAETGLRFEVADTGVGIPADTQSRLFDAFTQADATTARNYGGTGLGLTISRQLAEAMGGGMGLESTEGLGSMFWFTARFGRASVERLQTWQATEGRAAAVSPRARPGGDLRILLVEDNKVNQKVALGMLRKLGYAAECADLGGEALRLLAEKDYDLVFMDVQMPGMGGLEVTQRLRAGDAGDRNRGVAIIAMTAHATRQDRQACLDAGMNDYVAKPISGQRIAEAMARVLMPKPAMKGGDGIDGFRMDKLVERMDGDVGLAADILDTFLSDTAQRLKSVKGAALNWDFEFVQQEARTIEGGALNVHAEIVANLSRELVQAAVAKQQEYAVSVIGEIQGELEQIRQAV